MFRKSQYCCNFYCSIFKMYHCHFSTIYRHEKSRKYSQSNLYSPVIFGYIILSSVLTSGDLSEKEFVIFQSLKNLNHFQILLLIKRRGCKTFYISPLTTKMKPIKMHHHTQQLKQCTIVKML